MFLIRADGNESIGAGHLMRCMTIAEELARLMDREEICFVCADSASAALAQEHGFRTQVLDTDYREPESELSAWEGFLSGAAHRILVDSYFVTDRYLTALKKWGSVVLMDDLGTRCYSVDGVVNYNAPAEWEHYSRLYRGTAVHMLIGSEYVPIRRQFWDRAYRVKEEPRAVLITTGGGDRENIGGRILERLYNDRMRFYLVTGRFNPHLQKLKEAEKSYGNVQICHDVQDMAGLMEKCDIAVTAGGSTVYELAAVGVPFLCFSYAENQEALVDYVGEKEIAGSAGAWHRDPEGTLERLAEQFELLTRDGERRQLFSRREKSMIDGRGAVRLANELNGV